MTSNASILNSASIGGHHPTHADISSLEGDDLERAGLSVDGTTPKPGNTLRHSRSNASNGKTAGLIGGEDQPC